MGTMNADRMLSRARDIAESELHLAQRVASLRNAQDFTFAKRLVLDMFAKRLIRDNRRCGYFLDDRELTELLCELGSRTVSPPEFYAAQREYENQRWNNQKEQPREQ